MDVKEQIVSCLISNLLVLDRTAAYSPAHGPPVSSTTWNW